MNKRLSLSNLFAVLFKADEKKDPLESNSVPSGDELKKAIDNGFHSARLVQLEEIMRNGAATHSRVRPEIFEEYEKLTGENDAT